MKKIIANILFLAFVAYIVADVIVIPVIDFYKQYGALWAFAKLASIIICIIAVYHLLRFMFKNM